MDKNYNLTFTAKDCLNDIKEKILAAKTSVDIEIFYFMNDEIGSAFLDLLMQKARDGVKIRLLLDHAGSTIKERMKMLADLKDHGIKVLFFNNTMPFSKNNKTIWYLRDHRRTIIIDDEYLFTGSICIGQPTIDWGELGIFIKDAELAAKAKRVFNETWNKVYKPTFHIGTVSRKELLSLTDFTYLTQSPLQFKRHIYRYYINSIKEAKKDIVLVAPYFVPDRRFIRHIIRASKRQVNVTVIIPRNTEWYSVDLARNTYINHLLENNINIYFYEDMLHSKFAVFDGKEAFIGTLNMDNLSFRYNYECGVKVLNKECIAELDTYITNNLIPHSTKLDLQTWYKRGFFLKFTEKLIWIFRKFL